MFSNAAKLRVEHHEIAALLMQLEVAVMQADPMPEQQLVVLRNDLVRVLTAHLAVEDEVVYPELLRHPDPAIASLARELQSEMGGLANRFAQYSSEWTASRVEQDWVGFCRATKAIIAEFNERIAREDHELYALLDRLHRKAA